MLWPMTPLSISASVRTSGDSVIVPLAVWCGCSSGRRIARTRNDRMVGAESCSVMSPGRGPCSSSPGPRAGARGCHDALCGRTCKVPRDDWKRRTSGRMSSRPHRRSGDATPEGKCAPGRSPGWAGRAPCRSRSRRPCEQFDRVDEAAATASYARRARPMRGARLEGSSARRLPAAAVRGLVA
jgi:hypothetical protein